MDDSFQIFAFITEGITKARMNCIKSGYYLILFFIRGKVEFRFETRVADVYKFREGEWGFLWIFHCFSCYNIRYVNDNFLIYYNKQNMNVIS